LVRILLAPQEFKGSLTASQVAAAMAEGVRRAIPDAQIDQAPMADGGPGTLEAVVLAGGGEFRISRVHDPLKRPIDARWGLLPGSVAVIEMAEAAGLLRVQPKERDATKTTTFGVGELIREALDVGVRKFVIGVGGSGTNDGGAGMAQALGVRFRDKDGGEIAPGGLALLALDAIDVTQLDSRIGKSEFSVAIDVQNPLTGPEGASAVYGPQKGASPQQVQMLDRALTRYGESIERDLGVLISSIPGGGAAGGLAAGLHAFCGAKFEPGAKLVSRTIGLPQRIADASLVITGEGSLDGQTLYGKAVLEVIQLSAEAKRPVIAVAGQMTGNWRQLLDKGLTAAFSILPGPISATEAFSRAAELIASTTEQVLRAGSTNLPGS
jgi:glycerate 2-kinase